MLLSPDQRRALVTSVSQGFAIYDIASAHVLACSRDVPGLNSASPATFIHNGHAILIGCLDGRATLFDSENGEIIQSLSHEGSFPSPTEDTEAIILSRRGVHLRFRCTCLLASISAAYYFPIGSRIRRSRPICHCDRS